MVVHRFKYLFSGKNSFSTRREERSGKLKTGPCQKNQDVGVCSETGEVSYHTVRDFSLILFLHIDQCHHLSTTSQSLNTHQFNQRTINTKQTHSEKPFTPSGLDDFLIVGSQYSHSKFVL